MCKRLYKGDHPHVANFLSSIAAGQEKLGRLDAALKAEGQALAIRRRLFPEPHPDVALSLTRRAAIYLRQGDLASAKDCAEEALEIATQVRWARKHDAKVALARVHLRLQQDTKALELLRSAIDDIDVLRHRARTLGPQGRARFVEGLRQADPFGMLVSAYVPFATTKNIFKNPASSNPLPRRARHCLHGSYLLRCGRKLWHRSACSSCHTVPCTPCPFETLVVRHGTGTIVYWADVGPPTAYVPSGSSLAWLRERPTAARGPAPSSTTPRPMRRAMDRAVSVRDRTSQPSIARCGKGDPRSKAPSAAASMLSR